MPTVSDSVVSTVSEGVVPTVGEGVVSAVSAGVVPTVSEGVVPTVIEGVSTVSDGVVSTVSEVRCLRVVFWNLFQRGRANTLTPGQSEQSATPRLLPTVFKWEGGGKEVALAGSFNGWKGKIPLAKR